MAKRSVKSNIFFILNNIRLINRNILIQYSFQIIIGALISLPPIIFPYLIIDELIKELNFYRVIILLFQFALSMIVLNCSNTYLNSFNDSRSAFVRLDFLSMYYKKCMTMEYKYTEDPEIVNSVERMCTIANGTDRGILGMTEKVIQLASNIITLCIFTVILIKLNVLIPIIIFLCSGIVFIFQNKAKMYEYNNLNKKNKLFRKVSYFYNTMFNIEYGKDIRNFNLQKLLGNKFTSASVKFIRCFINIRKKFIHLAVVDFLCMLLREIVIYAYLIYAVLKNQITIGNFYLYLMLINTSAVLIKTVFENIAWIISENLVISEYRQFLALDDDIMNTSMNEGVANEMKHIEIEFRNVSFKYPRTNLYILKDINLRIRDGEKIAIVGNNGAGKTTFVKLLCKMFEPTNGEILINGVNINNYSKQEYYKLLSVVFQDYKSFAFSIEENIATQTDVNYDKLDEALVKSGLKEKVYNCPHNIKSNIDKQLETDGVIFSGGEYQKLALARAIYKEGKLFILDEPTSALDPIAEADLYENFNQVTQRNTTIFISHRLASTKFCDRIVVLNNGLITEIGTHEELIRLNQKYAEMFAVQARYYKEDEIYEQKIV